jgi:hypothetical protein
MPVSSSMPSLEKWGVSEGSDPPPNAAAVEAEAAPAPAPAPKGEAEVAKGLACAGRWKGLCWVEEGVAPGKACEGAEAAKGLAVEEEVEVGAGAKGFDMDCCCCCCCCAGR